MSVPSTTDSAIHANSIDQEVNSANQTSYTYFQKKVSSAFEAFLASILQAEKSNPADPNLAWLKYTAYVNTAAAFEFQCLAESIRDLVPLK